MTSKKLGIALLSLVVLAIFAVGSASAAGFVSSSNPFAVNISVGQTVFVGEGGLNITAITDAIDDGGYPQELYWLPGGSDITSASPEYVYKISNAEIMDFDVIPAVFESRTGLWYYGDITTPTYIVAFKVANPSLKVGLYREDGTSSLDGKKAIADEDVKMRVESTFNELFDRMYSTPNIQAFMFDIYATSEAAGWINHPYVLNTPGLNLSVVEAELDGLGITDLDVYLNESVANLDVGINGYSITPNKAKLYSVIYVPNPDYKVTVDYNLKAIRPDVPSYWLYDGVAIWSAGRVIDTKEVIGHKILTGEYQFYADINVNGMKDNLGEITGKTRSNTVTLTIDKETVTITADKETVIRNNGFSVKVEGTPKQWYAVWFTGVNGYSYTDVPAFELNQQDIKPMSYAQAMNTTYKTSGTKIDSDLPDGVATEWKSGKDLTGNYAIAAKLDGSGVINIGVLTN